MIPEDEAIVSGWSKNEPAPSYLFILKSSAVFLAIWNFLSPSVVKSIALSSPSICIEPAISNELVIIVLWKDAVSAFCKKEPVLVETTYDALSARTWCNDAVLFELTYDALSASIICKSEPLANELVCEFVTYEPVPCDVI